MADDRTRLNPAFLEELSSNEVTLDSPQLVGDGSEVQVSEVPALLVTVDDLPAALLRPLNTSEIAIADAVCAKASRELRVKMRSVDARIAQWSPDPIGRPATALDPQSVADMLADVIARVMNNPKGLYSTSDTAGPQSHSETYASARSANPVAAGLGIEPADLAKLQPAAAVLPRSVRLRQPSIGYRDGCW